MSAIAIVDVRDALLKRRLPEQYYIENIETKPWQGGTRIIWFNPLLTSGKSDRKTILLSRLTPRLLFRQYSSSASHTKRNPSSDQAQSPERCDGASNLSETLRIKDQ